MRVAEGNRVSEITRAVGVSRVREPSDSTMDAIAWQTWMDSVHQMMDVFIGPAGVRTRGERQRRARARARKWRRQTPCQSSLGWTPSECA